MERGGKRSSSLALLEPRGKGGSRFSVEASPFSNRR